MDLESVMCELAGTSNTSLAPLLSLEREQFMCQVIRGTAVTTRKN